LTKLKIVMLRFFLVS